MPIDVGRSTRRSRKRAHWGLPKGDTKPRISPRAPIPPPNFNVLLLADTREELQEIAAILPYYDVNRSSVQIIGPALWSSPSSGSGSVSGAWYAAPDSSTRQNLDQDYSAKYATPPPPLADLAFDAASIARVITGPRGADVTALTQPAGFVGADGWIGVLAGRPSPARIGHIPHRARRPDNDRTSAPDHRPGCTKASMRGTRGCFRSNCISLRSPRGLSRLISLWRALPPPAQVRPAARLRRR